MLYLLSQLLVVQAKAASVEVGFTPLQASHRKAISLEYGHRENVPRAAPKRWRWTGSGFPER
jgi:hypothetical protein